jgi:hypothetical protein
MDDTRNGTQPGVAAFPKETAAVVELSRGELRMRGEKKTEKEQGLAQKPGRRS